MKQFHPAMFVGWSRLLEVAWFKAQVPMDKFIQPNEVVGEAELMDEHRKQLLATQMADFERDCTDLELTASAVTIEKMRRLLVAPGCTHQQFGELAEELQQRLIDEMLGRRFFSLSISEARHYAQPLARWKEVLGRFPSAQTDIEELGKCLAFGRYTASVFHSLMVVEHGLVALGKLLGVTDPKEGWDASCKKLAAIVEAGHNANTTGLDFEFLSQLNVCAQAMKLAWRNKVTHATGKPHVMTEFVPDVAEEVIVASRAFMRRLADGMPKTDLGS